MHALKRLVGYLPPYWKPLVATGIFLVLQTGFSLLLQKLSLSFFERTSTGELMSRVTNDVNELERFITHGVTLVWVLYFSGAFQKSICIG